MVERKRGLERWPTLNKLVLGAAVGAAILIAGWAFGWDEVRLAIVNLLETAGLMTPSTN